MDLPSIHYPNHSNEILEASIGVVGQNNGGDAHLKSGDNHKAVRVLWGTFCSSIRMKIYAFRLKEKGLLIRGISMHLPVTPNKYSEDLVGFSASCFAGTSHIEWAV